MRETRFVIDQNNDGQFHWRLTGDHGVDLAVSPASFASAATPSWERRPVAAPRITLLIEPVDTSSRRSSQLLVVKCRPAMPDSVTAPPVRLV
jgi:hypothetical protein